MSLMRRVDPRLHLAAAIGWAVFFLVTVAAFATANLAAAEAERHARADAQGLLTEFATQVRDALAMHLETRQSLLQATAGQIQVSGVRSTAPMRQHLEAVQAQFPEFAWLGMADSRGRIQDAVGGLSIGADVSQTQWFQQGRLHAFVSDVDDATVSVGATTLAADSLSKRVVHVATPLAQLVPEGVGVLVGDLSWNWMEGLLAHMQQALDQQRQLEVMLVSGDDTVRVGPPNWRGHRLSAAGAGLRVFANAQTRR